MKNYVLAVLIFICIFKNSSADWKIDAQVNHLQQINSIINQNLSRIKEEARRKNTPEALECQETARLDLKSLTQSAYNKITSCTFSASSVGSAHVCSHPVDASVFEEALNISKRASDCIKNS